MEIKKLEKIIVSVDFIPESEKEGRKREAQAIIKYAGKRKNTITGYYEDSIESIRIPLTNFAKGVGLSPNIETLRKSSFAGQKVVMKTEILKD